ncbi:MAG: DUF389 domain-containing protein [Gemmatimonadota bacterium]
MAEEETNAIEEAAGEKLGVRRWDRAAVFGDAASAAIDNALPYWIVLVLSGGIATLGLAINSSAVVIGAMLVAPLLAPVVGLALALAVGDGRLAVQTGTVVVGSTIAVVLTSALLTVLLPFQTITLEISARTQPTTLDLAIAVFSGLVAVVVTVARGSRLSAAIPGVAISVALIPPLAVAGFGIGAGWNWDLIYGSILLYGASLAGIVLSGMGVFILVGMHRSDVVDAARRWHDREEPHGLAAWAGRVPLVRSLGVFSSPWSRVALVLGFAIALGIPLSESLAQIARETRVERGVGDAAQALFALEERSSILSREVVYGSADTRVYLRVATTEWFGTEEREEFERRASADAREPVRLSLEQLPARGEDLDQLASLFPRPERTAAATPAAAADEDLFAAARLLLEKLREDVVTPPEVYLVGLDLTLPASGTTILNVAYAATEPLQSQAEEILRRQLARSPELPGLDVRFVFVSTAPRRLDGAASDSAVVREAAASLESRFGLRIELLFPGDADPDRVAEARRALIDLGVEPNRIRYRGAEVGGLQLRLVPDGEAASSPDVDDVVLPVGLRTGPPDG